MAGTSDTSARVLSELGIDALSHAHHLVRPVSLPCALPQLLRTPLGSGGAALLDSAMIDEHLGRWSFLAPRPRWVAGIYRRPDGALLTIEGPHKRRRRVHLPGCRAFDLLGRIIRAARMPAGGVPERCVVPFIGGLVGYLGYELLHDLERVPELPADDLGLPDCMLAICDTIVALDHIERRAFLSTIGRGGDDGSARRRAQRQLDAGSARLAAVDIDAADRAKARAKRPPAAGPCGADADHWRCSLTAAAYRRAVETIRERIAAGDLYQANLTMRMSAPFMDDPAALYELLRQVNPAPFAGLLRFPGLAVVSSSPERFLRLDASGRVETRPIKGTCPRGADPQADRALRVALQRSEKDRAEHVMIVDLLRNDLGRVCRFGSVRVPEVLRIEEYARVFQMVSAVVGRLSPGHDVVDLLRAAFPGGSMTGAPKVAAMKLISRLEPVRRGVYSGCLGYFDARGGCDLSIVIRTIVCRAGRAYVHAGGAVVADSEPQGEYDEAMLKAEPLIRAVNAFRPSPQPAARAGRPAEALRSVGDATANDDCAITH